MGATYSLLGAWQRNTCKLAYQVIVALNIAALSRSDAGQDGGHGSRRFSRHSRRAGRVDRMNAKAPMMLAGNFSPASD
jgi:3-hydroxyisobutyrate dehydrogenase-like beta-hydroxyacid dehydrogenase